MGRTLVIDLNAPIWNRFRQVDHRTIQSIILKNVKYNLGRKSTLKSLEMPKEPPRTKWDVSKLKVGDWFSENQYYKYVKLLPGKNRDRDCIEYNAHMEAIEVPEEQLLDCWSGHMYDSEEKITRTEMVDKLVNAKECVFTVTFRKLKKDEDIAQRLRGIKDKKELQDKNLAKELIEGKLHTITGHLLKSENALGRSMVIDLNESYGQSFRLVDHRTVQELTLQNVHYVLKK